MSFRPLKEIPENNLRHCAEALLEEKSNYRTVIEQVRNHVAERYPELQSIDGSFFRNLVIEEAAHRWSEESTKTTLGFMA